jgi:hypothetical protein
LDWLYLLLLDNRFYNNELSPNTLITSPNRLINISSVYFFLVDINSILINIRLYKVSGIDNNLVYLVLILNNYTFY